MKKKRFTEQELLEGLGPDSAHADDLAKPLVHEQMPLERLNGSVLRYERPFDSVWGNRLQARNAEVKKAENY